MSQVSICTMLKSVVFCPSSKKQTKTDRQEKVVLPKREKIKSLTGLNRKVYRAFGSQKVRVITRLCKCVDLTRKSTGTKVASPITLLGTRELPSRRLSCLPSGLGGPDPVTAQGKLHPTHQSLGPAVCPLWLPASPVIYKEEQCCLSSGSITGKIGSIFNVVFS